MQPAIQSSGREFLRRDFFDTVGLPPTPEELERFTLNSRAHKSAQLIDSPLQRPEYASFWTVRFEDRFRNNPLNYQVPSKGKFKEWLFEWLAEELPPLNPADRAPSALERLLLQSKPGQATTGHASVRPAKKHVAATPT